MRYVFLAAGAAALVFSSCKENKSTADIKLNNGVDSLSYAVGVSMGTNLAEIDLKELNYDVFVSGIKQTLDSSAAMDIKEASGIIEEQMTALMEKKSAPDRKVGEDFLANNKTQPGVMVTPSGLQYKVITEGTGAKPGPTDEVTVNYRGTLISGEEFDSSYGKDPVTFPLNQVIPGWTEGVGLMSVGSKYMLYVPQELGYGSRGQRGIKPYATLIFEVELLSIKPGQPQEMPSFPGGKH
jgi:FKBP-type peptidyl-prolyl cis-trans isomerase